jgi:plastocyanin
LETLTNILKTTDSDKDGLSDYEEVVTYKTNPNNKDSDGDGFFDKSEIDRGYNPLGPGKLEIKVEQQPTAEEKKTIKINASNYKFEPSTIEVGVGEDVRIELTSLDTAHTFTIDALNIDREVKSGETEIIEFKAEKAGEYTFYSNKSADRLNKMEGKLIVK